jgi:hypothetical protein
MIKLCQEIECFVTTPARLRCGPFIDVKVDIFRLTKTVLVPSDVYIAKK